ncbi:ribosomal protein S18-alanine N-acetyltransferase [Georgenia faecalis]|uniref:Ribosomal protein S18-alanine N-acetyltransferase n=1 Tax=Georgenia faecalis TaxID=2483799 RepID=A0ABV9D6L1_9MICO|nr:ribosomal protein S18-alanine N-acetyltransferase [Georgenia faecalis]
MSAGAAGEVRLRALDHGDLDRVMELEPILFGRGAWSRGMYREELAAPDRYYVAAVDDAGTVLGYAGLALADEASVMTVGVAPEHRRRGIGALLLADLLARARAAGCRRVFLEVRAGDAGAQRLYARAGFASIGVRRGYYAPEGEDAVVMALELTRPPGPVGAEAV